MTEKELIDRIKQMALRVIRLVRSLPRTDEGRILRRKLLRSATSVAANYRSACKARSHKDFINKLGIAEEEADETHLWLELMTESDLVKRNRVHELMSE